MKATFTIPDETTEAYAKHHQSLYDRWLEAEEKTDSLASKKLWLKAHFQEEMISVTARVAGTAAEKVVNDANEGEAEEAREDAERNVRDALTISVT